MYLIIWKCFQGKISGNGILLRSAQVECQKKKTTIFKTKNEFKTCQIFIFERMILFACVDLKNTDAQAPLEYWTHFQVNLRLSNTCKSYIILLKLSSKLLQNNFPIIYWLDSSTLKDKRSSSQWKIWFRARPKWRLTIKSTKKK